MLRSEASFALPKGYDDTESGLLPIHEDPVLNEGNSNADVAIYIPGYVWLAFLYLCWRCLRPGIIY